MSPLLEPSCVCVTALTNRALGMGCHMTSEVSIWLSVRMLALDRSRHVVKEAQDDREEPCPFAHGPGWATS